MDLLPLHPKIVHLPIALSVLMPLVSLGTIVAWIRGWLPRRAFAMALVLQAILVGTSLAGLRSGEADEERVEAVVDEAPIEEHEEAAQVFTAGTAVVLVLMLAAVVIRNERIARSVATVSFLGTLAVLGLGYRAGAAGGELIYVHGAADAFRAGQGQAGPATLGPEAAPMREHEEGEE